MPYSATELARDIAYKVSETLTVYLNIGDPGANGTAGRVTSLGTPAPTIAAGVAGWTISGGTAENTAAVDFGAATAAITGVSWYSLFRGAAFVGRRALAASMDVANGANVTIAAGTIDLAETSVDA